MTVTMTMDDNDNADDDNNYADDDDDDSDIQNDSKLPQLKIHRVNPESAMN